ncbi:MAG: CapA family protein [Faecousia sp.]
MGHKPKYARQEPRRNTGLKLLPLLAVAVLAVILIVRSVGGGKPASADDSLSAQTQPEETLPATPVASATVGVQGDLLMHKPVIKACTLEDGGYDFESIFRYVAEYTAGCDYSVANLETTLGGDGYPYQGYPDFNCPDEIAKAAKDAGLDMLLTVNNHSSDTTTDGILRTVTRVREIGLTPLGTQLSDDEPKYAVVDVEGIQVGMTAYTYATSEKDGRPSLNFEPEVTQTGLVNYYTEGNLERFYSEVQSVLTQMKATGAETTMLYIHWGTEYSLQADATQRTIAQKLCDLGVDVIVGGHPHVVEPMELLTSASDPDHKTVVIYSLGNAVSNQRRDLMELNTGHTEDGALFTVTFEKYPDGGVYVADVGVMPTWVNMSSVNGKLEYNILPLDDARRGQWQSLYSLDEALFASAAASYDRTMSIVGPGLEQCRSYLAQAKQAREAVAAPTEEAA